MLEKIKIIKLQGSGSKQLRKVKKLVKLGFLHGPCLQFTEIVTAGLEKGLLSSRPVILPARYVVSHVRTKLWEGAAILELTVFLRVTASVTCFGSPWHKPRSVWEEGMLTEKIPPKDWPVGNPKAHFLDWWLMYEDPAHCGPELAVLGSARKHLSKSAAASW